MRETESTGFLPPERERLERMQRIIFGRLALIFVLLLASWWWTGSYLSQQPRVFPTSLFLFFLVSLALTGIYHLTAYLSRNYLSQKRVQLFVDVLLISWLVWETGDINSPYVSLYIVLICVSGLMLDKIDSLAVAIFAALTFITLSVFSGHLIGFSTTGDLEPSRFLQTIGFNVVAILFVGLLAARIGERKRIGEELRRSEESFADLNLLHERILQSVSSGLITTDLEGTIYGFNRAAESISGFTARDVVGQNLLSIFGDTVKDKVDICLGAVQTAEFSSEHFETHLPAKSGAQITVACSISPLFRRTGGVVGLIVTFQDISQVRALEESLRRADRLAAVGRMAAGLAHEIRNPLGSLSSSLQFLRERTAEDSEERALMDVGLREAERLNAIITNFLSYARPSADALHKPADDHPTDLDAAIRDCLLLIKHNPKVNGSHRFSYEPASSPLRSRISETQLKQVFWNLMQNSIQAMPDGGDITVRLNRIAGKRIQMVVQDNGPGFTPETLERLYEPFSSAASGTGLGLSIVHKIVKENGGRIDVNSVDGRGTKVVVELPS